MQSYGGQLPRLPPLTTPLLWDVCLRAHMGRSSPPPPAINLVILTGAQYRLMSCRHDVGRADCRCVGCTLLDREIRHRRTSVEQHVHSALHRGVRHWYHCPGRRYSRRTAACRNTGARLLRQSKSALSRDIVNINLWSFPMYTALRLTCF